MTNGSVAIVVMGPFRSGTSLASRILSMLNVEFGPQERMIKADRFNPDGYFQHVDVRIANNRLIKSGRSTVAWPEHPRVLSSGGDLTTLRRARLDWTRGLKRWGIKDPRFCATLLAWINAGIIDPLKLSIVRVERHPGAAAVGLLGMPELSRQLSARTVESAQATIMRYAELAAWHTNNLAIPSFVFDYDALLAAPKQRVADLSDFLGLGTKRQIETAAGCVRAQE